MTPQPHPQHEGHPTWEPYWITPPELYENLNAEFHFDFDPCPFPKPNNFDGTKIEWGKSNYVNPPFHKENGIGPTAFVRKAIEENKKGKTVVLTIPTQSYVNLLLEAGAELRPLGRVKWLHTVTREPIKGPSPITAFILRGAPMTPQPQRTINDDEWKLIVEIFKQLQSNITEPVWLAWQQIHTNVISRPAPSSAPNTLGELKITQGIMYEFCEWFCYSDCEEKPCNITVSHLHERLEGIQKQMKEHPEYLAKWNEKRAEQDSLRSKERE